MKKNKFNLLNVLAISGLLAITGCVSTTSNSNNKQANTAKIDFTLPQQIQWKQIKNKQKDGNSLAEWIPAANKTNSSSPVRVLYRRIPSNKSAKEFLTSITQPLQKACVDVKATALPTNSKHPNQVSIEVLCSRLGKLDFGTVSYLTVYADGQANYFLMSEVKLPPSKKAGSITPKNQKEKNWAITAKTLAKFMQQLNTNTRFCDTAGKCQQ